MPEKFEDFHKNTFEEIENDAFENEAEELADEAESYLKRVVENGGDIPEEEARINQLHRWSEPLFDEDTSPEERVYFKTALEERVKSDPLPAVREEAQKLLDKYNNKINKEQ